MLAKKPITQSDIADIAVYYRYRPEDGALLWAVKPHRGIAVGSVVGGTPTSLGYRLCGLHKKTWLQHRVVWAIHNGPLDSDMVVDHVNGDPKDNRIENLRLIDQATNMQNRREPRKASRSGVLGASKDLKHKKWRAKLMVDRKNVHIGYFSTPEAAHQAYLEAKRRLHPGCTL